jgi:hypothetical protein
MERVCRLGGTLIAVLPRNDIYPDDSGEHTEVFPLSRVREIWGPRGAVIEPVDDEHARLCTFVSWNPAGAGAARRSSVSAPGS